MRGPNEWKVKPQTIYVRADLKIEFRTRRNQNYSMDVTLHGTTQRVHFTPAGDVVRVETLTQAQMTDK